MRGNGGLNKAVAFAGLAVLLVTLSAGIGCQKQVEVQSPVVVSFTAAPASGNAPLTVQFTDQTTGPVSQWWWFFGDGHGSTKQNPTHTYTSEGVYTVYLVVIKADNSYETLTKEACIKVGNPAPGDKLTILEASHWDYDIPPETEFVTLDLAGEGVLYWTSFSIRDKDEVDWIVPQNHEHSIYIDYVECYGAVDAAGEIWDFQQTKKTNPGDLYPAIYYRDDLETLTQALWRVNVPFHRILALISINKDFWGTVEVEASHTVYSLVSSGVSPEEWGIKRTSEELEFPIADKIKTALESEFGKRVFSVGIVRQPPTSHADARSTLWVDAPEIERAEIRDFLHRNGFVEFAQEQGDEKK